MTRFGNLAAIGIVVALAGIAGCKKPEEPPAETPVARLAVEPRVMEFGEVEEGAVVKKEFTVRNVGAAAFVITDILAGCPCTTGEAINPFLAPGEETAVRLSFNSDGYPGQRTQYVTVRIDDSRTPDEIVQLRGNVQPWLLIDPSLIVIREAPTEKAVRHTAQAMNLGKAPVTIESIETGEQPVRLPLRRRQRPAADAEAGRQRHSEY
ncbi:MAG: DUF1573 domain-containing protein [Deltaproteobacteria bacterium]|nr:DUF1573 domain-containing protein [Deltaproteobacteria bacterium]